MKRIKYKRLARPAAITAALLLSFLSAQAADYNITSYGAVANDSTMDTTAIQKAIDAAYNAGGGRVVVPTGTFISGKVTLKAKVQLYVNSGGVLQGSANWQDYGGGHYSSFIYSDGANDASIQGFGTIDGVDVYDSQGEAGERGPYCITFNNATNILVRDVTITRAANWALDMNNIDGLTVDNVKIRGGEDGLDLHKGCKNITVKNCDFRTSDDCFAGDSITGLTVTDCLLNSSVNAFRMAGKNITVKRCKFWGPGEYPHSQTGTAAQALFCYGSVLNVNNTAGENILFEDCIVENAKCLLDYYYGQNWMDGLPLKSITFRNVTATGMLYGVTAWPGDPDRQLNIYMEGVDIRLRDNGSYDCIAVDTFGTVQMKAVTMKSTSSTVGTIKNGNYLKRNRVALLSPSTQFSISGISSDQALSPPFTSGSIFRLTPQHATSKCLDVSGSGNYDGANVHIWTYGGSSNQKWKVTDVTGGGVYELTPQHATTRRLDVSGAGTGNGANVQIWTSTSASNQRWRLLEQGSSIFELVPLNSIYRRLDVSGAKTADETNVQIWQDANANQQRWKLQTP